MHVNHCECSCCILIWHYILAVRINFSDNDVCISEIAKKRWRCLRGLRVEPARACEVIVVCFMLSNRARSLNLGEPDDDSDDDDHDDNDDAQNNDEYDENQYNDNVPVRDAPTERARVAAGQAVRNQLVNNFFV